jgi:hypothetical protein
MFNRLIYGDSTAIFTIAAFAFAASIFITISWRALRMKRTQVEHFAQPALRRRPPASQRRPNEASEPAPESAPQTEPEHAHTAARNRCARTSTTASENSTSACPTGGSSPLRHHRLLDRLLGLLRVVHVGPRAPAGSSSAMRASRPRSSPRPRPRSSTTRASGR